MYYLRSKAAVNPIKFTVSAEAQKAVKAGKLAAANGGTVDKITAADEGQACDLDDPDCLMCSG
jgi:hypothetical protein